MPGRVNPGIYLNCQAGVKCKGLIMNETLKTINELRTTLKDVRSGMKLTHQAEVKAAIQDMALSQGYPVVHETDDWSLFQVDTGC